MKKRKKTIPPVLPIDRFIEPERLGGDPINESSGGNPDAFIGVESDLSNELSFRKEDIPIMQVPDPVPDCLDVPEGPKLKKVHFPQWA